MGVGSRGQDSQGRARPGAREADSSRGAPTDAMQHPVPSLLDEADDKFAHFDGLVCLESDDLLPGSRRRWVRVVPGSPPLSPHPYPFSPVGHSHPGSCPVVWDLC